MKRRGYRTKLVPILIGVLVVGALLVGAQAASAADSGGTVTGEGLCMQRIFIGNDTTAVTNSNKLNCTANDISVAKALSATCSGANCVDANTCDEGKTFDLIATFQVNVTANSRYDAGFFFRIDGGDDARGDGTSASGVCSLSWLTPPPPTNIPVLDLDGDTCGDLNAGTFTNITLSIPGVLCKESEIEPGRVALPNCTSWHSNQGTVCDAPLASASDANRFDFHPDTKSKCTCDDTFTIPIGVKKPTGSVSKTATQADVTYSVTVTNTSALDVQVTKLLDNKVGGSGSITSVHDKIQSTTCAVPQDLDPAGGANDSYTCTFVVRFANPGTAGDLANTVTATLHRTADGADTTNDLDVTGSTKINVNLDVQ
jgi:hypothetical protein